MRELQKKNYSCGPATIRFDLYMSGIEVSESSIRKLAKTTKKGTNAKGIIRALKRFGKKTKKIQVFSPTQAWRRLLSCLNKGKTVFLCCDDENHWVLAVGGFAGKIWVFDPDSTSRKSRRRYCALELYSKKALIRRWGCVYESGEESFFAISAKRL
ncbi:MAG: hypothetical protein A2469_02540 [Candidatus Magasanikbacteria bacterium RIFOXYC2_FULL_40_16]|nr:MAG: hypothetical protein A2469_02540 [Candidatus Magasanikbacteria bacterium RIFOXYC2_FULL_40_16]